MVFVLNSSLEDLIDRIYVKVELLESRISLMARGEDRVVIQVLDLLNQIYDLLAELRRSVRSRCT
jgi:chaperonin cofactor prefoldin